MYSFFSMRPWQAVTGAVAAALLVAANPLTQMPAEAAPAAIKRISGDTRLATAARVAEESFPSGTEWAVLTSADDWHATLGAAPLAGKLKAAQLLTWPERLDETAKALDRLGVKRVVIVGSISKVSGAIERDLRQKYTVERISPADLGAGNQYELARLLTARTIVAAGGNAADTPGAIPETSESTVTAASTTATPTPLPSSSETQKPSEPNSAGKAAGEDKAGDVAALPSAESAPDTSETSGDKAVEGEAAPAAQTEPAAEAKSADDTQSLQKNRPSTPKWQVPDTIAKIGGKRTVFIASGNAFPDALAASAVAYRTTVPVLFVDQPGKPLPQHTSLALKAFAPEQIVILGGTSAVGADTVKELSTATGAAVVERIAGADRVATSVAFADWSVKKVGFDPHTISVARGDAFPDAVTAGQYAGNHKSPILLSTGPKYLTQVPVDFVLSRCKAVNSVVGFGGRAALDDSVLKAFSKAGGCTKPTNLPHVTPGKPNPTPTTPNPSPTATPTTPAPSPSPSNGSSDAMTRLANTKWRIHPEIKRQIRTNASGMQDVVGTLSILALHGTSDGSKLPKQVNWGLLACNKVRLDGNGVPIFSDSNNDGYADGLGHASNEGIDITGINGRNVANGKLLINQPVTSGMTNAILTSGIDDCAWVAAFDPADNNKIKVNKEGRAITPLGLGWLRIGNGPKPGELQGREVNPRHIYTITPESSTKRANEGVELTVQRKDGKALNRRLSVVSMPCKSVTTGQGDVLVKPTPNDPRAGLGYGNTDTNRATITHFLGKPEAKPRRIFTGSPQNGQFKFTVNATGADCGAFMVIEGNGNGKLDLDAAGRPTEPFGVGNVRWTK